MQSLEQDKVAAGGNDKALLNDTLDPKQQSFEEHSLAFDAHMRGDLSFGVTKREDPLHRIAYDQYSLDKARDRYLLNGKEGQKLWNQDLLEMVKRGYYRPTSEKGMLEVVNAAEYLLRGGEETATALAWHLSPNAEEQGVAARYNFVLQKLEASKKRGEDLSLALMTDEAWAALEALERGGGEREASVEPVESLAEIAAMTQDSWTRIRVVGGGLSTMSQMETYQRPIAAINEKFDPIGYFESNFGAGFRAGSAERFDASDENTTLIGGLPLKKLEDSDFDFEMATRVELPPNERRKSLNAPAFYFTLPGEDGDERIAILFSNGRVLDTTRKEIVTQMRMRQYQYSLMSEANEPYRKAVAMRLSLGLSPTGAAWLKRNTHNGELLERDADGTWVGQSSNVVSTQGIRAYQNLSETDQKLIQGILFMNKPVIDADGWGSTAWNYLMKGTSDLVTDSYRGTVQFFRWAATSESEMEKFVEEQRLRDKFNALSMPEIRYDVTDPLLRYTAIGAESLPATALFFTAGNIPALAKVGSAAARGLHLGAKGTAFLETVFSHAPLAFWQTMGGYERSMMDLYARIGDDKELARTLTAATWWNLSTGFVDYLGEYTPVAFGKRYIAGGGKVVEGALRTGSRRAALRAGADYMGRTFAFTAINESVQETLQNMAMVPIQGVVDACMDYKARHGSLEGFNPEADIDWNRLAYEAGQTVLPSIATSAGLAGMTQGIAGLRLAGDVNTRVNQIRQWRAAMNAAQEASAIIGRRREAKGVHLPAYLRTMEAEVKARIEAKAKELGRELTKEERAETEAAARDDIAVEDMRQVYNRWSTTADAQARDNVLNELGLSETEKADLRSAFDTLFAYRRGAQFGAQVANTAASVRAAMAAVGLKAEVWQGENGSVRVRFGQGAGQETEIRFVQNVADPQAEGHAAQGAAPDGVFIPAPDGSEVEAGAPLRAVIEIQEQSQGGSTFLLGHELAHNLLDVLRRTGTLTAEQDAALTEHFRDEAGAFDEEAFADAFGLELRNAFTEQENARLAERPKTRIGQLLRTLADAVRLWARALTAWRKTRAEAPTAAKGTPATVLDAFLAKQPLPTEQTTGNATEATDTTADTTPEGAEAQPAQGQAETAQAAEATPEQGTEAPAEAATEAQTAPEEEAAPEATPDATPEAAEAEAKPVPEAERKLDGMTEEEAVKEAREGCDDEDYEAPWHDLDAYADVLENEDGAFAATYVPLDEKKFGTTGLSTEIPFEHTAPTDKESFLSAQDEIDGISTCLPGLEGSTFMLLRKTSAGITVYGERARDIVDALENKEIEHNSNIERIDEKIDEGKETPDGDTYDESWYRVTVKGRKNVAKLIGGLLDEGNVAVLSDGSDDVEVYVPQAYAKDLTTFEEAQAENEAARKEYDAELSKRMDEAEAEVRERYRKAFGEAPEATGGQTKAKYHIPDAGMRYNKSETTNESDVRYNLRGSHNIPGDEKTSGVALASSVARDGEGGASGGEYSPSLENVREHEHLPGNNGGGDGEIRETGAVGVQVQSEKSEQKYHMGGLPRTFPKGLSVYQWVEQKVLDSKYFAALKNGNEYEADRIVLAQAAREGYEIPAFHGSNAFGFTVFSLEKLDDEQSIFATNNIQTAKSYTSDGELRRILSGMKETYDTETFRDWLKNNKKYGFKENEKWTYALSGELFDSEQEAQAALKKSGLLKSAPMLKAYPVDGFDTKHKGRMFANFDDEGITLIGDTGARSSETVDEDLEIIKDLFGSEIFEEAGIMGPGIYNIILKMDNPLRINAKGSWWNAIRDKRYDTKQRNTREWSAYAIEHGYDGVIFENVIDNADDSKRTSDVYIVFSSNQVKSVDTVTYDDNGKIIPPSKRFNENNPDIRYHIPKPQAPGFSESAEGKRVVAAVLDALMAADPAMVLDKAGKARTKEAFAEAVEAQAQAPDAGGTKAAREALARLGELRGDLSEAAWEDVLATAYEVCERFGALAGAAASKIEAGKLTERMAEYLRELSRNRATELGRRAYFAGREFAWRQARAAMRAAEEAARRKGAAALEELRRRRAADAEAYRWELADERFLADYRAAKARAMADKRVAALRREMEETLKAMRLRQARKDAARREAGITMKQLARQLGFDVGEEIQRIAYSEADLDAAAAELAARLERNFLSWVRRERPDLQNANYAGDITVLSEAGERAFAETVGNLMKAIARKLTYGRARESLMTLSDAVRAGVGHARVAEALEGKLGLTMSTLRAHASKGMAALFKRRMKKVFAEARKRLEGEPAAVKRRFLTTMKQTLRDLERAMGMALEGDGKTVGRRIEELSAMLEGDTPDGAGDGLTERQHRRAMELMFLERFGGLAHMANPAEAYALASEAEGFVRDALFEHVAAWEAMRREAKAYTDALVGGLAPASGDAKKGHGALAWAVPSLFDRLKWPMQTAESRAAVDALERRFSFAAQMETKWNRADYERLNLMAARAYGLGGEGRAQVENGHKKWMELLSERRPEWSRDLSLDGHALSRANLIYIYAALRQASVYEEMAPKYERFSERGTDAEGAEVVVKPGIEVYMARLEEALDAGDIRLAQEAVAFFAEKREPLSAVSERLFGVPVFAPEENYVPLKVQRDVDVTAAGRRQFLLAPNFLKQRVRHDRKLEEDNLYNVMLERSRQQNRWMAYAELYQFQQLALGDGELGARLAHALGERNMEGLRKQIQDVFTGVEHSDNPLLKFGRTGAAVLGLGFNMKSTMLQLEGIAAWAVDMGIKDTAGAIWSAVSDVFTTREGLKRFMAEYRSDIITSRMDTGSSREMQQAIATIAGLSAGGKPRGKPVIALARASQMYSSVAFAMLKYADAFCCALVMAGLRPKLEEKWRRLGKSEQEAKALANTELDVAVQRLQQSGRPEYLSNIQRSGDVGALLTMFTGPAAMSAGIQIATIHDVWKGVRSGDPVLWKRALWRLAAITLRNLIYAFLNNMAVILLTPGGGDDEERSRRLWLSFIFTTLFGGFGGMAILGPLVNTAIRLTSEWLASDGERKPNIRYALGRTVVSFPAVDSFLRAGANLYESSLEFAESDFDAEAILRYALEGIAGTVTPGGRQAEALLEKAGVLEEE